MLSLEEKAITKKWQEKKCVNAATHDPMQNYSNKGPTADSNNSDEEDSSGELKMTIADTRKTPTAQRHTQNPHCAKAEDNPCGSE
jgi:hypothetical protein